jgi:hypothetical protein
MNDPVPEYVTCPCQHCNGKIEFDANELGEEQNITVPCPYCQLETIIFVPPAISITSRNISHNVKSNTTILVVIIGLLCISILYGFAPIVAVCLLPVFAALVFIVSHFRPLTDEEISCLASKRRLRQINAYYQFSQSQVSVNLEFKKGMAAEGSYYNIHTTMREFPSIAAALLKYKRHEWIVIGFEKDQKIDCVWLNKGPNNRQVTSHMSFAGMAYHAHSGKHTTVIVLHNHPNPDPQKFYMLVASEQDKRSAKTLEDILSSASVNLLEFICERGRFREFHRAIAPSFISVKAIIAAITVENNVSRGRNFQLHLERLF